MGYEASLKKAWDSLQGSEKKTVWFLNDRYEVDFSKKTIFSLSCNVEAKDYYKILCLHYLANEGEAPDIEGDDWISFKEMDGGEIYFPAFRKRAIEPILRKYGDDPAAILDRARALDAEKIETGSAAISIRVFPKVKAGIILWSKDEEFGADCNMLFNRGIKAILPTEDVAVLGGIIASLI